MLYSLVIHFEFHIQVIPYSICLFCLTYLTKPNALQSIHVVQRRHKLNTELPKVLWWWSPSLKPTLSNSRVYFLFCETEEHILKGRMCLLAFRSHSLTVKPMDINHIRLSGHVLIQTLKEGLCLAGHLFEYVIFTSVYFRSVSFCICLFSFCSLKLFLEPFFQDY